MAALAFRFATIDDVPQVVVLVESAYRGDSSRVGWTTEADLLHGQRTDEAMVADALGRDGVHVLLAERDGELIACCELTAPGGERDPQASGTAAGQAGAPATATHGCSADSRTAGSAYLGMFAVRPELQGGGIGRAVLDEAARIARDDWHAEALELSTLHPREELIAWYERCGFTRTGELRAFPYDDPRFGLPQVEGIEQVVLSRPLR